MRFVPTGMFIRVFSGARIHSVPEESRLERNIGRSGSRELLRQMLSIGLRTDYPTATRESAK